MLFRSQSPGPDGEDEDALPDADAAIDVHLREAERILLDLIRLTKATHA